MPLYEVTIVMSPIEIEADTEEEANEIAADLIGADAWTRLHAGLVIEDFETEQIEE